MTLFGWHITHLSPHRNPSEANINSTCTQDSQISLCGCFDEYKGKVTPLKSAILSFFYSFSPITLSGWHITHLLPKGPQSEAQINSMCPRGSQISLCGCFDVYKMEMTPLKSPEFFSSLLFFGVAKKNVFQAYDDLRKVVFLFQSSPFFPLLIQLDLMKYREKGG